jgi:hypothetical protein
MRSDVYLYEDVYGGYTIHIRDVTPSNPEVMGEKNLLEAMQPYYKAKDYEGMSKVYQEHMENAKKVVYEPLHCWGAGETMNVETPEEMLEILANVSATGGHVPYKAYEGLWEDIFNGKEHE